MKTAIIFIFFVMSQLSYGFYDEFALPPTTGFDDDSHENYEETYGLNDDVVESPRNSCRDTTEDGEEGSIKLLIRLKRMVRCDEGGQMIHAV